jgi:hypothetical protein
MIKDFHEKGYLLMNGSEINIDEVLEVFAADGLHVNRDVVISNRDQKANLSASKSDFWFHTDGVFMASPPRVMIIELIKAESGGETELLDVTPIKDEIDNITYNYGKQDQYITADIFSDTDKGEIFRYRKDYMWPADKGVDASGLHVLLEAEAEKNALKLGGMQSGDILILDNWRFLHRRRPFKGERKIRRIWLGQK